MSLSLLTFRTVQMNSPGDVAFDVERVTCFNGVDTRKHKNRTVVCNPWLSRNERKCVLNETSSVHTQIHRHHYFFQCGVFPLSLSFVLFAVTM